MEVTLWLTIAAAVAGGYALGSIPFGLLLTRFAGLGDVRNIGSGNIGATNVLRTGRKGRAAVTLRRDVAKGLVAVLLFELVWPSFGILAGAGNHHLAAGEAGQQKRAGKIDVDRLCDFGLALAAEKAVGRDRAVVDQ